MPEIRLLTLRGSPKEIGRSHGEEYRDLITEFHGLLAENLRARSRIKVDDKPLADLLRKNASFSAEYSPELYDEVIGIAEGAKLTIEQVFLLNSFLDILNTRDSRTASALLGCTSFGACGEATVAGKCLIGQNYEMESFYKRFATLLKIKTGTGSELLVYSYVGVVGCAGLNSEGIGVCINFLHARDTDHGVVYPFRLRRILDQKRIGDAVGAATIGHRAGGINFLLGDSNGIILDVETSAKRHDILFAETDVLAHSNHYVSPRMQQYDLMVWDASYGSDISRRGSSIIRWHVANKMLAANAGRIDVGVLKSIARNEVNFPFSICCHGLTDATEMLRGETNASMIYDLQDRVMFIAPGKPCQEAYVSFEL